MMRSRVTLTIEHHEDLDLSQFVYYWPDPDEADWEIVEEEWEEIPDE